MSELCFQDRIFPAFHKYGPNIAIRYGTKEVCYRELDKRSECVLNWLFENDVPKGSFIGIYIRDKIDFIAAMIGIIKAGCVFVPLDTELPVKRIENMIHGTHTRIIFSDDDNCERLSRDGDGSGTGEDLIIIPINDSFYDNRGIAAAPGSSIEYSREDKIYVYFTSGSTGVPKAVLGKNKSLLHFIDWEISTFSIDETFRVSQFNSPEFDAFLRDVFVPLAAGGTVCIPDGKGMAMNAHQLVDWIDSNRIHLIHCVPGLFRLFNSDGAGPQHFKHLKYILLAGERVNPSDLTKWYDKFDGRIKLVNLYGPTETTMVKTFYYIDKNNIPKERVPIGKPMKGSRVLILDKQLNICGEKTIGEIYIRTPYATFGYYNDPGLTGERFIPNPFSGDPNDLFYKTGDLGRMLPDGNIEFVGRIDRQVKINGIRVEPEETEKAMLTHPAIAEAVVTEQEDNNGETRLCAYYVTGKTVTSTELREYLALLLPSYMIPASFLQVENVPLLPGGKIDFTALQLLGTVDEERDPAAPPNEIEQALVKIWSEVLEIDEASIGIDDFFTDLDGQSLKAIMMSSWIHKKFNVSVPIHAIFELATIKRLAGYINGAVEDKYHAIEPMEEKEYYRLSPGQKRLYVIKRMEVESIGYNVPQIVPLEGDFDIKKLEQDFKKLVGRHESFRTSFELVADKPVQKIHQTVDSRIEYFEPGKGSGIPPTFTAVKEIVKNFIRPFHLEKAPLIRVGLIKKGERQYVLMVDMHHIISDATSRRILLEDFLDLHEGKELPALRIRYRDYSEWINSPARIEVIKRQESFWLTQFQGELPVLNLPLDFPRPKVYSFEGGVVKLEIGKKESAALQKFAMEENATVYMVFLAVFNVFLAKISGQEDIVVGNPVVGRRHTDLERIVGIFINTLAMRNYPRGEQTFREFLGDLRKRAFNAFENQYYPFEDLVDRLSLKRDISRNPLCDVMFGLQEFGENSREISRMGLALPDEDLYDYEALISKSDLQLSVVLRENLYLLLEYSTKLFKRETVERFRAYIKKITMQILAEPGIKLSRLDILTEEEKKQIIYDFNDTHTDYPGDKTIHRLFEDQAQQRPDSIAIVGSRHYCSAVDKEERTGEPETVQLTYGELNKKANRLAHFLRERGVHPGTIVGIMMERSIDMIVGISGILKAGGAYLPIDPGYPEERIGYMVKDSNASLLLTWDKLSDICTGTALCAPVISPATCNLHLSLAYIIYTSGTTGTPKGVLIRHSGFINLICYRRKIFGEAPGDRMSQVAGPGFDAMASEVWPCLANGAALVIADDETRSDAGKLKEWLITNQVTISFQPTVIAEQLLVRTWPRRGSALRTLMTAGEQLTRYSLSHHPFRFYNLYGPTEDTVWTTWTGVGVKEDRTSSKYPPIGKPIANHRVYIVENGRTLQPIGVEGELCIGGAGLALGYLNRPELTADRFIHLTLNARHLTLYRTGDLVRWLPDGNIEFLGRIDQQVKIRGYRVELGEIESHLREWKKIKEVVVIAGEFRTEDGSDEMKEDKYICAYFAADKELSNSDIRDYLANQLPDYMIPAYSVQVEKIPLNPNGKVDRKALPSPVARASERYVAPRDEIEKKLAEIWAEVLNVSTASLGIDDNFFDLGGHSLKATILVEKIHQRFKVRTSLADVFRIQTIKGFARYIRHKDTEKGKYFDIKAVEKREYYELSPAQKRLYFMKQLALDSNSYNVFQALPLGKDMEKNRLKSILKILVARHDSLRTSFVEVDNRPVQLVHDPGDIEFEIEYFALDGEIENETGVEKIARNFMRPFDLSRTPLFRAGLIKSGDGERLLMIDMHHIVTDGTSQVVLAKEFAALCAGAGQELAPLRLQYKDYSEWQYSAEKQESITRQKAYWLNTLSGEIPVLNLPTDYPRPSVQTDEGNRVNFTLNAGETKILKDLTKEHEITLYMALLAVLNILFSKLGNQEDIIFGTPIAARRHADLQRIVGMMVNTLALRNYPAGHKTVTEFLEEVKQHTLAAYENQEYQFEALVDEIAVVRDAGRNPVFDVMLNLLNLHESPGETPEVHEHDSYVHKKSTSRFDMMFAALDMDECISFGIEYSTKLFKPAMIERFIKYIKKIVASLPGNEEQKLADIEIITAEEKEEILRISNGVSEMIDVEADRTIHRLFERKAKEVPAKTALVFEGQHLGYEELNKRANRLARVLGEKGIGSETGHVVGLMKERSLEMIIAILAILKAGSAYLPIDPEYPADRILAMLSDSGVTVLLTDEHLLERFSMTVPENVPENMNAAREEPLKRKKRLDICFLDKMSGDLDRYSAENLDNTGRPGDLLYVIYTSGSTGTPKGVMLEHRNLVNLIAYQYKYTPIDFDRVLQFTTISFDVSFQEIFSTLLAGGKLVLVTKRTITDIPKLLKVVEKEKLKTLFLPASFLKFTAGEEDYIKRIPPGLSHIVTAGEQAVINDGLKRYLIDNNVYFHNHYGPAEAHVVTALTLDPGGEIPEFPSIGRPVMNTGIYILDKGKNLQPAGVPGELFIGGVQVGRGYLNNPELTAEKFINFAPGGQGLFLKKLPLDPAKTFVSKSSPHLTRNNKHFTLYKTGDLARWLADGNLEFLGRIDHQVKIRGFRVELGEIESRLARHDLIKEAVVIHGGKEGVEKYLCAYIVSEGEVDSTELKTYLRGKLPDYMIPSYFVQLDQLPLTPSSKLDRRALPDPVLEMSKEYAAPRDEREKKLVEIWAEVLDASSASLGIDDNFFDVGGHSLKATTLVSKINKTFDVNVPLVEIFKIPTVRLLAEYIRIAEMGIFAGINDENLVLLKYGGDGAGHLFMIHAGSGEVAGYTEFCRHLSAGFNYWGIRADRSGNFSPRNYTIEELARKYIEKIKKIQPRGPYYLFGWCIGGTIAFEMAAQLEQRNEDIGLLALINSSPPQKKTFFSRLERPFQGTGEFSLRTELKYIKLASLGSEIRGKLKKAPGIEQFWLSLLEYFEASDFDVQKIKVLLGEHGLRLFPNLHEMDIRETVYCLNVVRTLVRSRTFYIPSGKIHTPLHFFAASQTREIIKDKPWNAYCQNPLAAHEVAGDHFSIFKTPDVTGFAKRFDKLIEELTIKNQ